MSPSTPKRKRVRSLSTSSDDNDKALPPKRRAPRSPPGSPTKVEERKAATVLKQKRKSEWLTWCLQNVWTPDPLYRQKNGSKEMHRGDAMQHYRLKDVEIDTLPYFKFENEHRPGAPGKSYVVAELERLVYRKFATLNGIPQDSLPHFLSEGRRLFEADTAKLEQRSPRKPPTIYRIKIVEEPIENFPNRPCGSWESPVYEDGVFIGWELNFQFDPEGNDDGFYDQFETFRPVRTAPRTTVTMPILQK
ncbi:hypothetical protein B0H11DRAFT_2004918 [Mycena galericulata]|nr:hypothetical protein B0H11DRAFT_1872190 [Mycena galericulata]KAJ7494495.1 hypothetical protein B0H11DRAFT_2004918 [Mycena galericulata]